MFWLFWFWLQFGVGCVVGLVIANDFFDVKQQMKREGDKKKKIKK